MAEMSSVNTWFRMYAEFAIDPKVQMMSESNQRRLTMLLCIRCNGHVTLHDRYIPLHDDEIAFQMRISNEEWSLSKSIFIEKGFIDDANRLLNWDKRQFVSDSSVARVARHRAGKKNDVTKCNVTVTPPDTDTDTDKDKVTTTTSAAVKKSKNETKPKAMISRDWQPGDRCMELIARAGISSDFAAGLVDEFILYWEERGDKRSGWEATFVNHAKNQWERRQAMQPVRVGQKSGQPQRGNYGEFNIPSDVWNSTDF